MSVRVAEQYLNSLTSLLGPVFFSLIIVNEEKVYHEKFYLQIVKKIFYFAKCQSEKNQKTGTHTRVLNVRMHVMSSPILRSCILPFKSAMIGLSA